MADKRTRKRVNVGFPVRVSGVDSIGRPFEELSHTINVSAAGLKFLVKTTLRTNDFVTVTLPLPREMRPDSSMGHTYTGKAVISRIEDSTVQRGMKTVVVKFVRPA